MMVARMRKGCNSFCHPQCVERNEQEYPQTVSVPNRATRVLTEITATFTEGISYIFTQNNKEGCGLEAETHVHCPRPSHRMMTLSREEV